MKNKTTQNNKVSPGTCQRWQKDGSGAQWSRPDPRPPGTLPGQARAEVMVIWQEIMTISGNFYRNRVKNTWPFSESIWTPTRPVVPTPSGPSASSGGQWRHSAHQNKHSQVLCQGKADGGSPCPQVVCLKPP